MLTPSLSLSVYVQRNNMQSSDKQPFCAAERKQQIVVWLPQHDKKS